MESYNITITKLFFDQYNNKTFDDIIRNLLNEKVDGVLDVYKRQVQVYVQGDNLFTIHRNQGLDPEQGITGITYYRYPAMRTISGGINVSF